MTCLESLVYFLLLTIFIYLQVLYDYDHHQDRYLDASKHDHHHRLAPLASHLDMSNHHQNGDSSSSRCSWHDGFWVLRYVSFITFLTTLYYRYNMATTISTMRPNATTTAHHYHHSHHHHQSGNGNDEGQTTRRNGAWDVYASWAPVILFFIFFSVLKFAQFVLYLLLSPHFSLLPCVLQ